MSMSRLVLAPYDPVQDGEVQRLFSNYNHKDHQLKVMGVAKDKMVSYLVNTLRSKNMQSICLRADGRLTGLIGLQSLPWMSEHFGLRMYAVSHLLAESDGPLVHARLLRYVIEELADVDFLDCRVSVDDVIAAHALEVCGFRYVGTEVYLGRNIDCTEKPPAHPEFEIDFCRKRDREQVLDIVTQTHVHNRFEYDPVIKSAAARSLYRRLVDNCFDSEQFHVLVARSGDHVQGFIISKMNPSFNSIVGRNSGSLDFIGVRPEKRSRGVGAALNDWAIYHLAQSGIQYVAVRTLANNYAALATCYTTGFKITSASLHFHRWIQRPARSSNMMQSGPVNLVKLAKSVSA